jgi:hypothetical protein
MLDMVPFTSLRVALSVQLTFPKLPKTIVPLSTFSYFSAVVEPNPGRLVSSQTAFFVEGAFGSSDRTSLQSQTRGAG